ncbi:MAG TPA: DUF4159 domain-containing protein [Pirellulaceae bacterium]|jgi:hypothetical protein|nr:DUF4159 domain-containing protein [Pirellulaceae bacterium]
MRSFESRTLPIVLAAIGVLLSAFSAPAPCAAQVSPEKVNAAVDKGVDFLFSRQEDDGHWADLTGYRGGVPALVTLALLNAGVDAEHPKMQKALDHLRKLHLSGEVDKTYVISLFASVFAAADPAGDRLILENAVTWLEDAQVQGGERVGSWAYSKNSGFGDKSNSQFAILALYDAQGAGIDVKKETWQKAAMYWIATQQADGGWSYVDGTRSTGSMTTAAISSLIMIRSMLSAEASENAAVNCCGGELELAELTNAIERGMRWLNADHFSVESNIGSDDNYLYYLYALERVGRLSGERFFKQIDWYRQGAERLLDERMRDSISGSWTERRGAGAGPLTGTSFALLFLSKGRRPVLVAKLDHRAEEGRAARAAFDPHPEGIPNLMFSIEKRWKQYLSWQTIPIAKASVEDLLQSPVLFMTGPSIDLDLAEKRKLKEYLEQGGFLFAEGGRGDDCPATPFHEQFTALMKELFPDSELKPLPPEHPIWFAEQPVTPSPEYPLLGLETCCRTSVVYCPGNLSCYWSRYFPGSGEKAPPRIRDLVQPRVFVGQNVLAYATNRELDEKLRPKTFAGETTVDAGVRGTLRIAGIAHGGGSSEAPSALPNLLKTVRRELPLTVAPFDEDVAATEDSLAQFPILFVHGREDFRLSDSEREALKTYLERGGFIFGDSICASAAFTEAFRREINSLFPKSRLQPVPSEHPMWTAEFGGANLGAVELRRPSRLGDEGVKIAASRTAPQMEGLFVDGRLAVVFSPFDLSCVLENGYSIECPGYAREDAFRIGTNILLFALQQ